MFWLNNLVKHYLQSKEQKACLWSKLSYLYSHYTSMLPVFLIVKAFMLVLCLTSLVGCGLSV